MNWVTEIMQDRQGNIWFCRDGYGACFAQFPQWEGLNKNEIYAIHKDRTGNVWIGANGVGVYRYDGKSFQLYQGTDRMDLTHTFSVQSILEDKNGTLWLGFSGGLFRFNGISIVNVTQDGTWK